MRPRREIAIALAIGAINSLAGDVPGLTTETPEVRELIEKIGAGECDRTARSIFGMHEIDQQDLTNGYRQPDEPSMVRRYFDPRSQAEAEYDANGNFTRVFVKRDEIGGGLGDFYTPWRAAEIVLGRPLTCLGQLIVDTEAARLLADGQEVVYFENVKLYPISSELQSARDGNTSLDNVDRIRLNANQGSAHNVAELARAVTGLTIINKSDLMGGKSRLTITRTGTDWQITELV